MTTLIDKAADSNVSQIMDFNMTKSLIHAEMSGIYGNEILQDMYHIIRMYGVYERGAEFTVDSTGDYVPANQRYKIIKKLIDKQARFLFSIPPDMYVNSPDRDDPDATSDIQDFLDVVLNENKFKSKLVKAAKDCFIGKRIAIVTNLHPVLGITVSIIPSLEFIFETDPNNVDRLTKFIQFYSTTVNEVKEQQRVYKKKWWLQNGRAYFNEGMYNGSGVLIEEITPDTATNLSWIPVEIVTNDGLSGDPFGVSEIEALESDESWYSKLSSKDIDSIRKGADQIVYTVDMSPGSTTNLSRGAGAFWDLQTDPAAVADGGKGLVGVVDNNMTYATALDSTLNRLKAHMHDMLDVPDTSAEALKGIVSSGKTLKAIYWGLITRCDEKMLVWRPALLNTMRNIIEGAKAYPDVRKLYTKDTLEGEYELDVENNYPIPEDQAEEKANDLAEVHAQTMSKKSYMKKWRGLTDNQADEELEQIALERELLENSFSAGGEGDGLDEDDEGVNV